MIDDRPQTSIVRGEALRLPVDGTLVDLFGHAVATAPDRLAVRSADGSTELTWAAYARRVAELGAGLRALGVTRGDRVALLLGNRPEFHLLDAAALHLGAVPFSVYATSAPEQIAHVLTDAMPKVAVVESGLLERYLAAGVDVVDELIVLDVEGDPGLSLAELLAAGARPLDLAAAAREVRPDDIATLIYTSGTTGAPKGVELTHANLVFSVRSCTQRLGIATAERLVSYLPHAHVVDRLLSHYIPMATASTTTTVADTTKVLGTVASWRPTGFMGVPRLWEKLHAALTAKIAALPGAEREPVERAFELGHRKVVTEQQDLILDDRTRRAWQEADAAHLAPLRAQLGFDEATWILTGAAPIAHDVHEFFCALGLPLCEAWGLSETSAIVTLNRPGAVRIGSVGTPMPGTELAVADDGELLTRGPHLMRGYRGDPERTRALIDDAGWLHTGDVGDVDHDGYVTLLDRKRELLVSSGGKTMSPTTIETPLKAASPLVGQAVAIGDGRPYNVALLVLDADGARSFATAEGLGELSLVELAEHPLVRSAVEAAVDRANAKLSRAEQIKRFALLGIEWTPGSGELTPTSKLKRRVIHERYADLIAGLYA